jgi:MscS family membrane protein
VQLEISSHTPPEAIRQLVIRIEEVLQQRRDRIENYTVFMADIVKNSYVLTMEFFTAPIPVADFNEVRQYVNIAVVELMNEMNIKLASKEEAP